MGLLGREISFTISLAIWIQYTKVIDGQTDAWSETGRQQRLHSIHYLHLYILYLDTAHLH